jgi:hypothetical protein
MAGLGALPQVTDTPGKSLGTAVALRSVDPPFPPFAGEASAGKESVMRRLTIFVSSLALVLACAKTPEAMTASVAVATTGAAASDGAPVSPAKTADGADAKTASYREVTLPAGTVLPITLDTAVGSDTSRVEQPVHGHLRHAVVHNGVQVLPAGAALSGHVTSAVRPGRVKGRGYVAMRFTEITVPGEGNEHIATSTVSRTAPATKGKDAVEILAPAAGGAVVGRLVGGKSAARKGALIGGAAGTGYVLSTRGKEIHLAKGAPLSVKLSAPMTLRVPVR